MLRGLRFFELFRRRRSFEERLSALQSTFDPIDPQSGGTQQALSGPHHPDDARAELLIGLNDNLDEMRQGSRARRLGAVSLGAAGIFVVLSSPGLQEAVLGGTLLVLALGVGWFELKRLRRVRKLQAWIKRELSSPMPKASLPQPSDGSSGETS